MDVTEATSVAKVTAAMEAADVVVASDVLEVTSVDVVADGLEAPDVAGSVGFSIAVVVVNDCVSEIGAISGV